MIQYAIAYTHGDDDVVRFIFDMHSQYDALARAESMALRSKKCKIISVFATRSLTSIDIRNIADDPQKPYYDHRKGNKL